MRNGAKSENIPEAVTTPSQLRVSLEELTRCIRRMTEPGDEETLEQRGTRLVRDLRDVLRCPDSGEPAAALIRLFLTVPYGDLDEAKQAFIARKFPDAKPAPDTKCLTLMGTVGDEDDWCTIEGSKGHQSIPLLGAEAVRALPMIARVFSDLGLEPEQVFTPDAKLATMVTGRSFDVFHVEEAVGSEYIPAQEEFVVPHGVQSVVGFGDMLPTGHLATVLIFSKAKVDRQTASLFRPLALGLRLAMLPFLDEKIVKGERGAFDETDRLRAAAAAQSQLLELFQETVIEQSSELETTLTELEASNVSLKSALDDLQDARARLVAVEKGVASKYAIEKLREMSTYRVAFIVGTLINVYGHFIVPWFRGNPDIWGRFVGELRDNPGLAACSIAIAYLFPVVVQVHSAVSSRMRTHAAELRADFPDRKPDPVFRVSSDGRIIDAGASTMVLLKKHGLSDVKQLLGEELWSEILELQKREQKLPRETAVHVDALDTSFLVTHSPAMDGAVNIYLTEIERRERA